MNDLMRRLLGLPEQASSFARDLDTLHFLVLATTMAGAAGVGLAAVWFAVRYRRRPAVAATARIEASLPLEWGMICLLTTLFVGWWWIGYRQFLRLQTPPPGALEITVSAKQWMWSFAYPGGQRTLSMLVVPLDQPVKLVMMSRDVIHGFFVPAFRIKHDVVPGTVSVTWFEATRTGSFQILCTQFCGTSHSLMRGEVVVLPQADYALWLSGSQRPVQEAAAEEAAERQGTTPDGMDLAIGRRDIAEDPAVRGRRAAARHACFSCHTEDGRRHIGPTWRGLYGSRVALNDGRTVVADGEYLTRSMMDPEADVVDGFRPLMPSYRGLLDPDDAAAIVLYIKSLSSADAEPPAENPPLPHQPYQVGPP